MVALILSTALAVGAVTERDLDRHVAALEQRLAQRAPKSKFHIVVESPFVVIGDGPRREVVRRAHGTVRWAARGLKALYFPRDPDQVLEIWLFNGERSYRAHAWSLFQDKPSTPYGYYSEQDGALIMNIATGGGTLVHEMVHPFVATNFPGSPPWLDEGLGSLYEHSGERDGKIVGYTNWRLPGLQEVIRDGELPSFKRLFSRSSSQFYNRDPGNNYAQARYLLYYLQERGLLVEFYRAFRHAHPVDPTGYVTLRKILDRRDMAAFQREWEAWVLTLKRS